MYTVRYIARKFEYGRGVIDGDKTPGYWLFGKGDPEFLGEDLRLLTERDITDYRTLANLD